MVSEKEIILSDLLYLMTIVLVELLTLALLCVTGQFEEQKRNQPVRG